MTVLAPATWWRGLAGLTRSGSAVEGLAWALYDFANTIFSFAIVSFAMSLWATSFLGETEGQRWFGWAVFASVLVNAIVSPILGAMSDRTGRRKPFLLFFTVLTIVPTALIGLVDIGLGLLAFALANFAYQAALIYYDALLPDVARASTRGKLSGIGVGLGYLGTIVSGLLFRFTTDADGKTTAASFILVASLFALFAVPLFALVIERRPIGEPFRAIDVVRSWSQLATSVRNARQTPGLLRFLVGRFFYTDPVNTAIAVMSAFAVFAVGFTQAEALNILLVLTVVAVLASFGWGWLNDRIGPKRTLLMVLGTWAVGLGVLTLTLEPVPFLAAGALLGAGLGGVGVTDRLLLLRLTPPARIGESLGIYGLVGKLSALIGLPLYTNIVATLEPQMGDAAYQIAIASLLAILAIGVIFLVGVPEGRAPADDLEVDVALPVEPAIVPPAEAIR
ncbi:MAG TPA: MFS transporter [Candidatus Limnocylindria bacterium]|nr:MFS transporter [Candidatus Limnocylindria bacterium]